MNATISDSPEIKSIQNHRVDLTRIAVKEISPVGIKVTFLNGDVLNFTWRDQAEKDYLLSLIGPTTSGCS